MDKNEVEADVIDIECIDTVINDDIIVIPEEISRDNSEYSNTAIPVSSDTTLKTGNIIGQFFNLISQARNRDYWKLEDKEIQSLNKTCPKILPKVLSEHAGIISCVLGIFGIIIKRLKLEREEIPDPEIEVTNNESEKPIESNSLTGGRTS